jgi:hypothetical protein
MSKLLSGRYFLTVIAGVAFLYLVMTFSITPKDAMVAIMLVFTLYFTRNDRGSGANRPI